MTLAIDFDGVIHDFKNPIAGRRMGAPIEGTKQALDELESKGCKIIVFSVWGDQPEVITDYMNFYELPFHEITNIKPLADYYIDDNAIRFTNWADILKQI